MSNVKKLWIGIGILVLLSPLGVIVPALFKAEGGWGEWGLDQIGKIAGFVPWGQSKLAIEGQAVSLAIHSAPCVLPMRLTEQRAGAPLSSEAPVKSRRR